MSIPEAFNHAFNRIKKEKSIGHAYLSSKCEWIGPYSLSKQDFIKQTALYLYFVLFIAVSGRVRALIASASVIVPMVFPALSTTLLTPLLD